MIKFDGFLKVYLEGTDSEDEEKSSMLPNLSLNENLGNTYISATQGSQDLHTGIQKHL